MQPNVQNNLEKDSIWKNVLESVKVGVSEPTFKTWFLPTTITEINDLGERAVIHIGCNSSFVKATLEARYFGMIQDALVRELSKKCDLLFAVRALEDKKTGESVQPLFEQKEVAPSEEFSNSLGRANLRLSYSFENFAVSSSNQMAHAAAEAVAADPGHAYNPLFIWGGVGVGKTHLMSAVGYKILKSDSGREILLCTGEQFTNDIVEGIRNKSTQKVRAKYRKLKVLMVDDIQFIAGKDTIQEEFFHTFNAVTAAGGQVIMTSDRPPAEIAKLEDRLRSRFEAGLIVDVAPLDFELKCAICLIKAKERGIEFAPDLVSLIAGNVSTARQIEGHLTKLMAASRLKNIPIDAALIKSQLGTTDEVANIKATPEEIIKAACKYFSILRRDLLGPRRARPLARPRQIVMYFLRKELNLPLEEVGRIIGGRDHTTVMHAVDKITALASSDEDTRGDIMGIKSSL